MSACSSFSASTATPHMRGGVPPLIAHLHGELDFDAAIETAKRDSRRYAKRQLTWFRNQTASWPRIVSLDPAAAQAELAGILDEGD